MKVLKVIFNIFLIIIAVGLSFGIFGVEMGIHSIYGIKDFLTVDGINEVVKNMDFANYLDDITYDDSEVTNDIYDSLEDNGFDTEIAKEIINCKELKEVIGNYVSSSLDAIINDKEVQKPTVEEINSIIENNEELLVKIAEHDGVTLTPELREEYINSLKESVPDIVEQIPDINEELKENRENISTALDIVNHVLSNQVIWMLVLVIGIFYLLISLLRWSFHKAMLYVAVPTILSSSFILLLSSGLRNMYTLANLDKELVSFLNTTIISKLSTRLLISGIIGFIIGILLVILFIFIQKIPKKEKIVLN